MIMAPTILSECNVTSNTCRVEIFQPGFCVIQQMQFRMEIKLENVMFVETIVCEIKILQVKSFSAVAFSEDVLDGC